MQKKARNKKKVTLGRARKMLAKPNGEDKPMWANAVEILTARAKRIKNRKQITKKRKVQEQKAMRKRMRK